MTRCCRDDINLKSSAYNQTGQSYVDQLSLHRSMCTHLRRVLLAKSVVDSRNPKYINAMHNRHKPSSYKSKFLEECPSNEIIEKLTYNTEHRPSEIIKVHPHRKMSSKERTYINDRNCPCLQLNIAKSKYMHKKSEDYQNYMDQDIKDIASKRWKFSKSKYESSAYRSNRQRSKHKPENFISMLL
ncbi:PREDICTED: uncharacterized protein LOC105367597 [Ceratosolen solmsi marchali]|uniref:Uncharacterized protein LOC105367597 n=1 Tax=Ceratosolen solmsi marchali TaxID=326594 RepID=A0AAJ6YUL8_9HYME|nr:PREDICTED: uncharacterized protein LOC105367597 [Ceratosolen solmsi marchali]